MKLSVEFSSVFHFKLAINQANLSSLIAQLLNFFTFSLLDFSIARIWDETRTYCDAGTFLKR